MGGKICSSAFPRHRVTPGSALELGQKGIPGLCPVPAPWVPLPGALGMLLAVPQLGNSSGLCPAHPAHVPGQGGLLSAGGALAVSRLRAELTQHLLCLTAPLASFKLMVSFPKETLDIN